MTTPSLLVVLLAALPALPGVEREEPVVLTLLASTSPSAPAPQEPWLRVTIELSESGQGAPIFRFVDAARAPAELQTLAGEEGEVEVLEEGGMALHFPNRPLDEIPGLLGHLPEDRTEVSVVVRVPQALTGADIWEFQAQLSAARIRQVRFESTSPGPEDDSRAHPSLP